MNKLQLMGFFSILSIAFSMPIWANNYLVTTTADTGLGSLRQAILNANVDSALDTITFAIPDSDLGCATVSGKSGKVCTIKVGSDISTFSLRLRYFCAVNVTPSSSVGSVVGNCTVVPRVPYLGQTPNAYIEDIKDPTTGNDYLVKMGEALPHITAPVNLDALSQSPNHDEVLIELRGDFMQLRSNARSYPDSTGLQDLRVPVKRVVVTSASDPDPKAFNCGALRCKLQQNGTLTTAVEIPTEEESGLFLRAKDSTIQGLAINRFGLPYAGGGPTAGVGIYLAGPGNFDPTAPISDPQSASNNKILKNYIGTDATGKTPNTLTAGVCSRPGCIGNAWNGLIVNGGSNNEIRGNVFGNNGRSGSSTESFSVLNGASTPTNNRYLGNYVGVGSDGLTQIANGDGLFLGGENQWVGCSDNPYDPVLGCSKPDEANIISGNGVASGPFALSLGGITAQNDNKIFGNLIGVDKNGNMLKNQKIAGIVIRGSRNLVQGNVISGNGYSGVLFASISANIGLSPTELNRIEYNKIGVNKFGVAVPNDHYGITILSAANKNLLAHNVIANNQRGGIHLMTVNGDNLGNTFVRPNSTPHCNSFLYNSIYNNGGLGIDLVSTSLVMNVANPQAMPTDAETNPITINQNDPLDADSLDDCSFAVAGANPNNFQNHPILDGQRSFINPALVQIRGYLDSKPNRSYLVQVFTSQLADPTGYGEGQQFVGEITVTTDQNGHVDFNFPAMANVPVGSIITSTATDLARGDTSEFSPWVNVDKKGSVTSYENAGGAAGGDNSANATEVDISTICMDPSSSQFLTGSC